MEIEDQNVEELTLVEPGDQGGLKAAIEAIVYVCEEPATAAQIANALGQPQERVQSLLAELAAEYASPARGLMIREVAGGYKMATKPEHHEAVRAFAKSLKAPLKLSLPALETLATIAYKQPVTAPEIMEIRGVQGAGVLKTLLDRKLIQTAGRKNVVGRPILYRTSKEFLLQFGLKDLSELPTLKEFEELRRLAVGDESEGEPQPRLQPEPAAGEPEALNSEPEAESGEPVAASAEPQTEPEVASPEPHAAGPEPEAVSEGRESEPEVAGPEPEPASPQPEAAVAEPEAATPPAEVENG